jgi:6-phosphogluconolactonase (cycloisomerase 2 family)
LGVGLGVTPAHAGFLYALNNAHAGNTIYGFAVNEATGTLTPLAGSPVPSGGIGSSGSAISETATIHFDSANARLYVLNDGTPSVSAFRVSASGALTALPFSPIPLPSTDSWQCLAIHPSGSPLIVGGDSSVASFNIGTATATAAAGSPYTTGTFPAFDAAFSQNGNFVYLGGDDSGGFAGFSVDAATGVLTPLSGSPFSATGEVEAYATDTRGRIFTANFDVSILQVFTTAAGIPTAVSGSPFPSGLSGAVHGVLHPAGFYMVADRQGNQVGVYGIAGTGAATTLAAVTGSPFAAGGSFTDVLALSSGGTFLFAANGNSRNLTRFAVDPATGMLSGATTQPADTLGSSGRITGLAYSPSAVGAAAAPALSPDALIVVIFLLVALGLYQIRGRRSLDSQRLKRASQSR